MHGAAGDVGRPVQGGQHLADPDRVAAQGGIPSVGGGGGHLARQGGRRHLAAGHAVNRVVHKDDGDILAPGRRVGDFRRADGGQVAVSLIGEDNIVRIHALAAGGHCRRPAVSGLHHVRVEVVVGKHGASDRRDADGLSLDAQLVNGFRHEAMNDPMGASGAVMKGRIRQDPGFFIHNGHLISPPSPDFQPG